MLNHIEKEIYIRVEVPQRIFNKTLKRKMNEITVPCNNEWEQIVNRANKFVRITTDGSYIDLQIIKVYIDKTFVIRMGNILDFDRQRNKNYKNNITGDMCVAETVQDAALHFGVNIRHVRRIYG